MNNGVPSLGGRTTNTAVRRYLELAERGLPQMFNSERQEFVQTFRQVATEPRPRYAAQGGSQRYTSICALGLSRLPVERQRGALGGIDAGDLAALAATCAQASTDPGAVALALWADTEINARVDQRLAARVRALGAAAAVRIVNLSWGVTALAEATRIDPAHADALRAQVQRLAAAQGPHGLFPSSDPASARGRWRAHVGSFADQVYPIQALSRASEVLHEPALLVKAERTADAICALQGHAGQWWWHYDARHLEVVEGFPVYSVHQHAMAPMALRELSAAGGSDHTAAIALGLQWLERHPEILEPLVAEDLDVIWRKVGRREPKKAARALNTVASAVSARLRVPGLDVVMPPNHVDRECRPYELGWLLYTWAAPTGHGE